MVKSGRRNRAKRINLIPFSLYKRGVKKYTRLPHQLLNLSIIKLDGSSFSIFVARNATVGKVRLAVEEEFRHSLKESEKSLWPVVWSHFCLCYDGRKLLDEKAPIKNYAIQDADKLHFVQHLQAELAPVQTTTIQRPHRCKHEQHFNR